MTDGLVIDGDGHLLEDMEAIARHMPEEFAAGGAPLLDLFPPKDHLHAAQPVRHIPGAFPSVGPEEWLSFTKAAGIGTAVLYPGYGLFSGYITNADWAIAVCRAYNDWLHETYLERSSVFVGMGLLPLQEPDAAADELRRIVTELGMKGAVLPGNGLSLPFGSKYYNPVYAAADQLGCAIAFHGGAYNRMGLDHMNVYAAVSALGHPVTQLICLSDIIFNGVFDRFPNTRFGFLEAGAAWLFLALERYDRAFETHIPIDPRGELIQLQPNEGASDYLRRQMADGRIFVGIEGEEPFLPDLIDRSGSNVFFLSSDFPHETSEDRFREEVDELRSNESLSKADRDAILTENARNFYSIP